MNRARPSRAFSLTELLVVISIILILLSILLVATGALYSSAVQVNCQHRLQQIVYAAQMFANKNHSRLPRSYDPTTFRRWYDTLMDGYLDNRTVLNCPVVSNALTATSSSTPPKESTLPVLFYNVATGRPPNFGSEWAVWGTYTQIRGWLNTNCIGGIIAAQCDDTALIPVGAQMLNACSQAWFLNTEYYETPSPVLAPSETNAIHDFFFKGGGIHCWSESYRSYDYYRSTNEIKQACGFGILSGPVVFNDNGGAWGDGSSGLPPSSHPVMFDGTTYVTQMSSAYSPAKFMIENNDPAATVIGKHYNQYQPDPTYHQWVNCIVAWDNGTTRVLLHGSYTSLLGYGGWPYGHIRQYCVNSDKWLRGSGGLRTTGSCTYGYNNQIGLSAQTPSTDTIVVMDYENWEIDRDKLNTAKNDDPSYVALRHSGRANCAFPDGSVRPLPLEDIRDALFTPQPGD